MSTATDTPAAQLAAALASLLSTSMNATATGQVLTLSFAERTFVLAVAEQLPDPCAGLRQGDVIPRDLGSEFDGTCDARHRPAPSGSRYKCNRKYGHTGVHVATYGYGSGTTVCCDPWGGDPASGAGATASGVGGYDSRRAGGTIEPGDWRDRGERCDDNGNGHRCVLAPGHVGKHVATNRGLRLECDPWSDADKRDPFSSWSLRTAEEDPTDGPDEGRPCNFSIRGDECTREVGHSGNHVSGYGTGDGIRDWCRPDGSGGMHG